MRWAPVPLWCTVVTACVTSGQASRVFSISPSSMRYPRILTCSSARPTYASCPSAPQHTKSPVRYIRAPGPPNGHATNRDPVKPGRRQYPTPTPRPATYNSPTTPAGTGRNQPSSPNNAAPVTGDPIGGAPDPAHSGALLDAHIVVSVGP